MTPAAQQRRYVAREAVGQGEVEAAQALRAAAFGLARADIDAFDARCTHVVIEDRREGRLAACFRLMPIVMPVQGGAGIGASYAAQFYDLAALAAYPGPMTELGRFCIHPAARDPDILRAAWGAIAAHVDVCGVQLLFGCTSFRGVDPAPYAPAFAALAAQHLAPDIWAPRRRAPGAVPLVGVLAEVRAGAQGAQGSRVLLPPLLRSYLGMGGWVGDHAVIDPGMKTIHVFTGLEIAAIPEARKARLRASHTSA